MVRIVRARKQPSRGKPFSPPPVVGFAGFSFDYDTPDASTIGRFRNHLLERGLDVKLFNIFAGQLEDHGLIIKQGAIVDASIVESSRRPRKTLIVGKIEDEDSLSNCEVTTTYSDDSEAKWAIKAKNPTTATNCTWPLMLIIAS
ncbi:hypothetical protein [Dethiosulfatarculus sandiegensis]|nr:hypothetical protein [Dethiosulfatarculus sandiegensis]